MRSGGVLLWKDDDALFNEILSSFKTGNDDILLKQYLHNFIEYTDTALYKSVFGRKALLEMLKAESNGRSFFGHDLVNPNVVEIRDIVVSTDARNGQLTKVGILYTKQNQENKPYNSENSSIIYGISTIEIEDQKIKSYFDVNKETNSSSALDSIFAFNDDNVLFNGDAPSLKNGIDAIDVVIKFFESRNDHGTTKKKSFPMNLIAYDFFYLPHFRKDVVKGKSSISSLMKGLYNPSSSVESFKFVIDDIFVTDSYKDQIETRIITKWHILLNDEMVALSRGCSHHVLKSEEGKGLKISQGIDILESFKVEKSEAHQIRKIISPQIQNRIRDSGIGRFIADSLIKISIPSVARDNPQLISNFFDVSNRLKEVSYGKHKSQVVDLIMPQTNPDAVTGLAFFVVSCYQ